uniref:Uncharacterized protein n=1 Tax=Arundo donax TaxID=35708 RepID=A0A0A9DPR4_ARUDO
MAAESYTLAASSAVSKVPSHTRTRRHGSRISAAYLPHGRRRTPRNRGSPAPPSAFLFLPGSTTLGFPADDGETFRAAASFTAGSRRISCT